MKNTLKKVFAAVLALALVISVAGCGKQETGLDADGNYEVVWYNGENPQPDTALVYEELNKYTKEKIGVTVKYQPFARAEYAEKMQLLFAAGEKIDLCYTSSGMKFESNARADAYMDIAKLLDTVGKPTKALIPPYALDVFSVGDQQFGIPVLKDWGVQYCVLAYKSQLEAAGMYEKAVNSTSVYDWTEIQRAVKAIYPDNYGILQRGNHSMFNKLPHETINGSVIGGFLTDDYSKAVNIYSTDVAAKFFDEMRIWYNEGFIKSDAATSTNDNDIRQRGNFLATHGEWLPYMDATDLSEDDPMYRVWCYGIGSPVMRSAGISTNGMAISATCVNPERTMEFVNLLYTDAFFHATNNLRLYVLTGCDPKFEFLHNMYKKQITTLMRDDIYGWHMPYHRGYGYHEGHFIENGFDSSYEYMNREEWVQTFLEYRACKNADPVLVKKMEAITLEMLEFETYFCLPQPGQTTFHLANAFTSRKANEYGEGNQPSYEKLFHDYPIAAMRWKVKQQGDTLNFSETYPQIINTEEWAWDHIEEFYDAYENYYTPESNRWGNYWPRTTYEAFNAGVVADSSDLTLPCYQEDGIKLNTSEVVAVKHKGLYLMNVYQNVHSYRKTYSMVGGAPLMIWSENTGVVERSKKIYGSTEKYITTSDALLMHASVYGTDGGKFFHSGKEGHEGYGSSEPCTLKWIEEGKKYEISGRIPDTDIIVTWTYELTDIGIDMTVVVKGTDDGKDVWLNFPVNGEDAKGKYEFDSAEGKLDYLYDGGKGHMRFTWDAANESKFLGVNNDSMNLSRLRIKIPASGLTMHIEAVK